MSWSNPSADEAAEEYYASKNRYNNAANQRSSALRAADNCRAEKSQAFANISSCRRDKVNFEKRIADIREIIRLLEGSGSGVLSLIGGTNVPQTISNFNLQVKNTDESYRGAIKCTDIPSASIEDTFRAKTVDEDPNTADALQQFKNEVARLEQAVRDLQAKINSLFNTVGQLNSKIVSLNAEAASCRGVMISSAFNMNHYKKYM